MPHLCSNGFPDLPTAVRWRGSPKLDAVGRAEPGLPRWPDISLVLAWIPLGYNRQKPVSKKKPSAQLPLQGCGRTNVRHLGFPQIPLIHGVWRHAIHCTPTDKTRILQSAASAKDEGIWGSEFKQAPKQDVSSRKHDPTTAAVTQTRTLPRLSGHQMHAQTVKGLHPEMCQPRHGTGSERLQAERQLAQTYLRSTGSGFGDVASSFTQLGGMQCRLTP